MFKNLKRKRRHVFREKINPTILHFMRSRLSYGYSNFSLIFHEDCVQRYVNRKIKLNNN